MACATLHYLYQTCATTTAEERARCCYFSESAVNDVSDALNEVRKERDVEIVQGEINCLLIGECIPSFDWSTTSETHRSDINRISCTCMVLYVLLVIFVSYDTTALSANQALLLFATEI